ncbi:MAG: hypothetical protein J7J98_01165 [candidate division Zixibacteria bacterium]|nr:hypothetical protein [candidate division Zixibacteria bacterium]
MNSVDAMHMCSLLRALKEKVESAKGEDPVLENRLSTIKSALEHMITLSPDETKPQEYLKQTVELMRKLKNKTMSEEA